MRRAFVLSALLFACGDDQSLSPPAPWTPPDLATAYDDPSDFDRSMCGNSAMGGVDLHGTWRLTTHLGPYRAEWGSLIVLDDFTALQGSRDATVDLQDRDAFIRAIGYDGEVDAIDLCHVTADGHLLGRIASCTPAGCSEWPVIAGRLARIPGEGDADGLELVAEVVTQGFSTNVRARDGFAYVSTYAGLEIFDVSDPAHPAARGVAVLDDLNDVKLFDGPDGRPYAITAGGHTTIIDVSDPDAPVLGKSLESAHTIAVETWNGHTRAYLAASPGLAIYDLDDPTAPRHLGSYDLPAASDYGGFTHDLWVEHGRVYIGYWDRGLAIVDTWDDPANARLVGRFMNYPYRTSHSVWVTTIDGCKVAAHGDEGPYAHLRLIGVDEKCPATFLRQLGEAETRLDVSIHNIMAVGTRVYASHYGDGIRVWDVANPAAPRALAYFNTYTWPTDGTVSYYDGAIGIDLDPDAHLVYVADTVRGLLVLRETF